MSGTGIGQRGRLAPAVLETAHASSVTAWQRLYVYAQIAVVLVVAVCVVYYFDFTAEDAYITYRYSETLVNTGALVYNPGEPINAMTSPLHALVSAGLFALTGQTVLSNKLLALGSLLLSAWLIWRRFSGQPHWQLLVLILVLMPPSILLWTFGGLETPLLLLLATLAVTLADRPGTLSASTLGMLGLLTGLAFLTRYDSVLFFLPLLAYAALRVRAPRAVMAAGLLAASLPLAWLAVSLAYYGDLLPTSFYVKTPNGTLGSLFFNSRYVAAYLLYVGLVPALALVLPLLRSRPTALQVATEALKRRWWLYLGLALELLYGLTIATHHMMFSSRYFVPYLPAAVLAVVGLVRRATDASGANLASRRAAGLLAVLLGALFCLQVYQEAYTYLRSINGLAPVGEYRSVGIRDYERFMQVLSQEAHDIEAHWQTVAAQPGRPPRVLTYAAGLLPYELREAYIYEKLVSYRHCHQRVDQGLYADYLHLVAPRHGTVAEQLPGPDDNYVLVSAYDLYFDGAQEQFLVYYNLHPLDHNISAGINDHCP